MSTAIATIDEAKADPGTQVQEVVIEMPTITNSTRSNTNERPLEARLKATNERIVHLLDQMSWQEETVTATNEEKTNTTSSSATTTVASLLSTCRPFDRMAFLAFVGTYSPLVWSPKDSLALSPLACARLGWICSEALNERDILHCPMCHVKVHIYFAPEVLSHPEAVERLSQRYAELLATSHTIDCPWKENPYEENFTRILPNERMQFDTAVWIALNQIRTRANSLLTQPNPILRSVPFHLEFMAQYRYFLQQHSIDIQSSPISLDTLLAICGWEFRSLHSLTCPTSPPLQCWFGCREICLEPYSDQSQAIVTAPVVESKEEVELGVNEPEEEERSILQSPIKRRKVDATTSKSAPSASAPTISALPPVRFASAGFHPVRSHRPFCPFLHPLPPSSSTTTETKDQPTTSVKTISSTLPVSSLSTESESLVGWQQLLIWYLQRQHQQQPTPTSVTSALESSGSNETATVTSPTSFRSLAHREQQYQGVVNTVRKLLANTVDTAKSTLKRKLL